MWQCVKAGPLTRQINMNQHYYAVIMAGGGGTRLWPVSRHDSPKQTLQLFDGKSLFQLAVERLTSFLPMDRILVVTSAELVKQLQEQVPEMGEANYIIEPQPRGTAAVVALAAGQLYLKDADAVLAVLTADHLIPNENQFHAYLNAAKQLAERGHIVTIGIKPSFASTGYGYIESGEELGEFLGIRGYRVVRFIEKPPANLAEEFLGQPRFSWNSGMFICKAGIVLNEYQRLMPDLFTTINKLFPLLEGDHLQPAFTTEWMKIKPETIDYGIMEKTPLAAVLPAANLAWMDVGSWDSFFDVFPTDGNGNVVLQAKHVGLETTHSLILSTEKKKMIVTLGMKDIIIIQTPDALLVCPRGESQRVKDLVNYLKEHQYTLYL